MPTSPRSDRGSGRPVIGITCYVEPASRGGWTDVPSALLPHRYVESVERAGGIALLVPPRLDADDAMARAVLDRLDGLVLAGGADVEPHRYGADPHPRIQDGRPDRDAFELALARVSRGRDAVVLGICRGMQVMAVAGGGRLVQHVPDVVGHEGHSPSAFEYGTHPVTVVPDTRIGALLGERLDVPTYHHQAVVSHPGYEPAAWAQDGTLEAMEDPAQRFRLAVQWHPEAGTDPRLFVALVEAAAGAARARHAHDG